MSIKKRVMDLLAKRDHSEKELKQKLTRVKKWDDRKERLYSDDEIKNVIAWAKDNRWLQEPGHLSERWTEALNRKNKGIKYINSYLGQKGLPQVEKNPDLEIQKAVFLIKKKRGSKELDKILRLKLTRFLLSRGFDSESINKAFKKI